MGKFIYFFCDSITINKSKMDDRQPIFQKRQVAEFNTSQDTLRQLATMEWNLDEMFRMIYDGGINKNDLGGIKNLYHYLVFIYADRLYSFAWTRIQYNEDPTVNTFEKFEKELKVLYNDWVTNHSQEIPKGLIQRLREYKRWLYEVKQKQIKLGVPTRTESTARERLEKAAGV